MSPAVVPIVDSGNPLYCPEVTASRYLHRIRQMRNSSNSLHMDSYTHRLSLGSQGSQTLSSQASLLCDIFETHDSLHARAARCAHQVPRSGQPSRKRKLEDVESSSVNEFHLLKKCKRSDISSTSFIMSPNPAQPRLSTLLNAAPIQESSEGFYHELVGEPANRMPWKTAHLSPRRVLQLEHDLYGYPIGQEIPESLSYLLECLNRELPGIFLSNRLSHIGGVSHQMIVDLLGADGYLARHILEYFRSSLVTRLDLSSSLSKEDGLNQLSPRVVLDVFSLPNSFTRLRALNLNGVHLEDFDLTRIHHLHSLDTLWLNNTRIGNEAIGHLTALKYQLIELHVEGNPLIDDDCVPSLCLFSSLVILRTYGTHIAMPGLRRLALFTHKSGQEIDIEIPKECEEYLNNLHTQYQLHPAAPLTTVPQVCSSLSTNALKANLAAHAAFNPSIYLSGSKPELIDRLSKILEMRIADSIVKELVTGYASSEEQVETEAPTRRRIDSPFVCCITYD